MSGTAREILTGTVTETAWQRDVVKAAKGWHWSVYHVRIPVQSPAGWPDLVLCRPPRLIFAELKRDGEDPTPAQTRWLELLGGCPVEVYVWQPRDADRVWHLLRPDRPRRHR